LVISVFAGFSPGGPIQVLLAVAFMILISTAFIGLGLIFASRMKDMQGFSIIMNLVVFPIFFLSGALYPLENLPRWIRLLSYLDPMTYGMDGLRGALIHVSVFSTGFDLIVMAGIAVVMVVLGAYFFETSEAT
jgi:ABC-2 type transport system permease protein